MASAAAGGGDFSDVPQLSSVYDAVSTGCTAQQLHLVLDRAAAAQGSEEARTAAANITGLNGESPLQAAHRLNRGDLVGALLLAGANAENLITTYRANALQLCIFHDQPEDALRALIRSGAPANAEIERHRGEPIGSASYGTCSLLHACLVPPVRESGDPRPPPRLKLLELLAKEGGVDVNTRGSIGSMPLHWLFGCTTQISPLPSTCCSRSARTSPRKTTLALRPCMPSRCLARSRWCSGC